MTVLPGRPGIVVEAFRAQPRELLPENLGDRLRSVVDANVGRHSLGRHGINQGLDDTDGVDLSRDGER